MWGGSTLNQILKALNLNRLKIYQEELILSLEIELDIMVKTWFYQLFNFSNIPKFSQQLSIADIRVHKSDCNTNNKYTTPNISLTTISTKEA